MERILDLAQADVNYSPGSVSNWLASYLSSPNWFSLYKMVTIKLSSLHIRGLRVWWLRTQILKPDHQAQVPGLPFTSWPCPSCLASGGPGSSSTNGIGTPAPCPEGSLGVFNELMSIKYLEPPGTKQLLHKCYLFTCTILLMDLRSSNNSILLSPSDAGIKQQQQRHTQRLEVRGSSCSLCLSQKCFT